MSYECDWCEREFYSWDAIRQHKDALQHWQCETCDWLFASAYLADQHMDELDHWDVSVECDKCDRVFSSIESCNQHMTALNHWFTDVCDTCNKRFVNRIAVEQHANAVGHRAPPYCSKCACSFRTENEWDQHMASPIHTRANPIHAAAAAPTRPTTTRPSTLTASRAPTVTVLSTPAVAPIPIPSTRSQPSSRPSAPPPVTDTISARLPVLSQPVTHAPAATAAQPAGSVPSGIGYMNTGTAFLPFTVFVERDAVLAVNSHYQSITFMEPYQAFSFEELRLADCRVDRGPANTSRQASAFGQANDASPSIVPTTASAPANVRLIDEDKPIQTINSPPEPSVYSSAPSSHATTPDTTHVSTPNTESRTPEFSNVTAIHMQEDLTALTDDDIANFDLIHEVRSKVMKLVKNNENKAGWISQGVGPIRILSSKHASSLRILMRSDPSGRVGLDSDVLLDFTLYERKAPKMLQVQVPTTDKKEVETFTCLFKDELKAGEFLNKLQKAIAKVQGSSTNHSSFSLSEIKAQHTEPVHEPEVVNCLFCRLGFYAVSDVIQHLETTSCSARFDLNHGNIHRYWFQEGPQGVAIIQTADLEGSNTKAEELSYHCPNMTESCRDKSFVSLAGLHAHLEGEDCDYTDHEKLREAVGNFELVVPPFGSC